MFVIVLAWCCVIGGKWFVGFDLVVSAFVLFIVAFVCLFDVGVFSCLDDCLLPSVDLLV